MGLGPRRRRMAGESLGVGPGQPLRFDEAIEAVEAAGGSNPYRLVVAGGRDFSDADRMDQAINQALHDYGPEQLLSAMNEERPYGNLEVVSGMATGADTLGRQWALDRGLKVHEYPAQWDALDAPGAVVRTRRDGRQYNAKAGYDRNALMAQNADAVLVMPGGSGTEHMVRTALAQGLPVYDARTGSVHLLEPGAAPEMPPPARHAKPLGRKAGQKLQGGGGDTYEVSTKGDRRFSALNARLQDGRTIEEAYQLDVKGYRAQGSDWRLGKGKPPLDRSMGQEKLYGAYKGLWEQWAQENPELMHELIEASHNKKLVDSYARTPVNQARALSEIMEEWTGEHRSRKPEPPKRKQLNMFEEMPEWAGDAAKWGAAAVGTGLAAYTIADLSQPG